LKILYSIYFIYITLVLSACAPEPKIKAPLKQELHISIGASPQSLDPHVVTGVPELHVLSALSEPLVKLNLTTLEVIPATAKSWEVSDDGLNYTFTLRENARWSDGSTLTAHDFVFSWQRALTPSIGWQSALDYYWKQMTALPLV